jgi:hypothetical protein
MRGWGLPLKAHLAPLRLQSVIHSIIHKISDCETHWILAKGRPTDITSLTSISETITMCLLARWLDARQQVFDHLVPSQLVLNVTLVTHALRIAQSTGTPRCHIRIASCRKCFGFQYVRQVQQGVRFMETLDYSMSTCAPYLHVGRASM